ncbi:hypothetical protein ACNQF7_09425, partial [Flavobacterium sp. RSP29]
MKSNFTLFLLAFLIFVSNINSYSNGVKIDPPKVSTLSNGTVQCNTKVPIPLVTGTFDSLTTSSSTFGLCLSGYGISNTATVTGNVPDPNHSNNTSTSTTTANIIIANDDTGSPVNGGIGGVAFINVLGNDTLNGLAFLPVQVNTTFVSSTHPGITLVGTNVVVVAGTPGGTYSLTYQICEVLNPTNCDQATVSVTVFCGQAAIVSASVTACVANVATITVLASGGTAPYTFSIDGGVTFQSSNIFTGVAAGASYTITIRDANGCLATSAQVVVALCPAVCPTLAVTATVGTAISCTGGTTTLTVTA